MPSSGITYAAHLEWVLAAKWANIPWTVFKELDGEEQSFIIAAFRTDRMMEAVVSYDENKKSRQATKGSRGKR